MHPPPKQTGAARSRVAITPRQVTPLGAQPRLVLSVLAAIIVVPLLLAGLPSPAASGLLRPVFVYAENRGEVFGFRLGSTGRLDPVPGSPWDTGEDVEHGNPESDQTVVFSKPRRLLFISNNGGVSVFGVEEHGSLSRWPGSPFGAGGFAGLAVIENRRGTYVYAAERARNRIRAFRGQGMTLTELPGSPHPAGEGGHSVAQTRSGFYCVAEDAQTITGFQVGSDGELAQSPGSPYRVAGSGDGVWSLAIEPQGRFLYGADGDGTHVHGFRVVRTNGASERLAGSPFPTIRGHGSLSRGAAFARHGLGFAFGGGPAAAAHIQTMRRLSNGALRPVGKSRLLPHGRIGAAAVDPTGRFLLTGDIEGGSLSSYRIQRRGQKLAAVDREDIEGRRGSPRPTGIAFAQF